MKKIYCQHCKQIIGFEYKDDNYTNNTIISPNKFGYISQCKIRGDKDIDYDNIEIGYILETQLTCRKCNKKTTTKTKNNY